MVHHLADLAKGFEIEADVVVVGSGAGGAVAASALVEGGLRVVLLEAGPVVRPEDMTRDAPAFLSKYYWEGGLRMLLGSGTYPTMSGRCLGGSTVINSAIMFALPDWVRKDWIETDGLEHLRSDDLDAAYARIFERTGVAPTPMEAQGRRNLVTRDVLDEAGLQSKPLPRAVRGCKASGDCLTGCASGAKQSVDRVYLPDAIANGLQVFTCAHADKVTTKGGKATGVEGWIVDPAGRVRLSRFRVKAPKVFVAAGALHTPVLLQKSGLTGGGLVGATFAAHVSSFALGVMQERIDPWYGATQGWGAFSDTVRGLKFESLWAPTSLIASRWGGAGPAMHRMMADLPYALMIPLVYRAQVTGRVRTRLDGMPDPRLWIPRHEVRTLLGEVKRITDAFLRLGARYVYTGVHGVPDQIRTAEDSDKLLSAHLTGRNLTMTANHVFCSARMTGDPRTGPVDLQGRLRDVEGVWVTDASVFPSPSAVNPQATVMALSDLTARRVAELPLR